MSFNEKLSYTEVVVKTPTTDFNIGFSFTENIDKLGLLIDGVAATEAGYTYRLKNNMTLEVTPPIASGTVRIYRETNLDTTRHVFKASAKFVAANMDTNFTQLLHSQQEIRDQTNAFYDRIDIQINDFTVLVSDVQGEFRAVRDQVDAAEAIAAAANSTSQNALAVANTIDSTAQQAFNTAQLAFDTAYAVNSLAVDAQATVSTAVSTANAASSDASTALGVANGIASTASNAVVIAESAQLTADTAKGIANDALLVAQDALDQTALQPATETVLGGVKVGAGLAVTSDGVLSNTGGMPLGVPLWHNGLRATLPVGHLPYDGLTYNRADYPAFWVKIQSTFKVISDTEWLANPNQRGCYSSGDGSTTFRMPDLNGVQSGSIKAPVLRGDGGGTVATEPKTVGQMDTDAIRNIKGTFVGGSDRNLTGVFTRLDVLWGSIQGGGGASQHTYEFDASLVVPTAPENRMNSVYGIWICRVGDALTESADPTEVAVLTGGNTFNGSQKVVGNLEVIGTLNANIKPLLNATGEAPISACRAWINFNGTNLSIRESMNVLSVATIAGGFRINFIKPMPSKDFVIFGSALVGLGNQGTLGNMIVSPSINNEQNVSYADIMIVNGGGGSTTNCQYIHIGVFC